MGNVLPGYERRGAERGQALNTPFSRSVVSSLDEEDTILAVVKSLYITAGLFHTSATYLLFAVVHSIHMQIFRPTILQAML